MYLHYLLNTDINYFIHNLTWTEVGQFMHKCHLIQTKAVMSVQTGCQFLMIFIFILLISM